MEKLIIVIVMMQHILDSVHLGGPCANVYLLCLLDLCSCNMRERESIVIPVQFVVSSVVTFTVSSFHLQHLSGVHCCKHISHVHCAMYISILWDLVDV